MKEEVEKMAESLRKSGLAASEEEALVKAVEMLRKSDELHPATETEEPRQPEQEKPEAKPPETKAKNQDLSSYFYSSGK